MGKKGSDPGEFCSHTCVAVDDNKGTIYVAEMERNQIKKFIVEEREIRRINNARYLS